MSNRLYNQFLFSPERQPVSLMGSFTVSVARTKAVLVANGITYTAVTSGTSGNSITVRIIGGGTAGSEVVTVVGSAITIEIEDGVSNRDQVQYALDNDTAASALITSSAASGGTAATLMSATHLAGAVNGTLTSVAMNMSAAWTNPGELTISLEDPFPNLLSAQVTLLSPTASSILTQVKSAATAYGTSKTIVINCLTNSNLTDLAVGQGLYVHLIFRNSSN